MRFFTTLTALAATVSAAPWTRAAPKILICSDSTTANYDPATSVLQGYALAPLLHSSIPSDSSKL
jgi:hypothetical protein